MNKIIEKLISRIVNLLLSIIWLVCCEIAPYIKDGKLIELPSIIWVISSIVILVDWFYLKESKENE